MRKSGILIAIFFSMCFLSAATLFAAEPVPFPQDLKIVVPDKGAVPERLAEFSGIWEGSWIYQEYSSFPHQAKIAVEEITLEKATVVYGWGLAEFRWARRGGYSISPGWLRIKDCPVEKAADGSYVITVKLPERVLILRQKDSKDKIFVTMTSGPSSFREHTSTFERKK